MNSTNEKLIFPNFNLAVCGKDIKTIYEAENVVILEKNKKDVKIGKDKK